MVPKSVVLYETRVDIDGWGKGRQARYKYILLEGQKEIENSGQKHVLPCFGVEIIREDFDKGRVCTVESDRIECLSTYRHKVSQLVKKLYINLVSPIHLIDIAGPLADEWVSDFDRAG
jgi:hypothetical protein